MPPPRPDSPFPKGEKSAKAKKKASGVTTASPSAVAQSTRSQTRKTTYDEEQPTNGTEPSPTTSEHGQTSNSPDPFRSEPRDTSRVGALQLTIERTLSKVGDGLAKQIKNIRQSVSTPPISRSGTEEPPNVSGTGDSLSYPAERPSMNSNSPPSQAPSIKNGEPAPDENGNNNGNNRSPALSYASLEVHPSQTKTGRMAEMVNSSPEPSSPNSTPSKRPKRRLASPLIDLIDSARNAISRKKKEKAATIVEETPPPPETLERPPKKHKAEQKPHESSEDTIAHIISPAVAQMTKSTPLPDNGGSPSPQDDLPPFTPRPPMGFPDLQLGAPTEDIVGLEPTQLNDWKKARGHKVLLNPLGYGGDNARERNWVRLMLMTKLAVILNKDDLEVIPPIPECETGGINKPPFLYYLDGLTYEDRKKLTNHECWSAPDFTFFALPFNNAHPSFVMNVTGLCGSPVKIKESIAKSLLKSESTINLLERLIRANEALSKMEMNAAIATILDSIRITHVPSRDTNDVPTTLTSIYINSPAQDTEQWCEWIVHIRDNVEICGSFTGKGRRCPNFLCEGCHGVNHTTDACPFKYVPGWYGVHDIANIPRPYLASRNRNETRAGTSNDPRNFDTTLVHSPPSQNSHQPLFRSPYFRYPQERNLNIPPANTLDIAMGAATATEPAIPHDVWVNQITMRGGHLGNPRGRGRRGAPRGGRYTQWN
ncbi:hypothetical protein NLI96_g12278 [Meripilus lineatus]|uniref:Uncharacterized protein n=1 Tax=Meripilus lineatus TaxID=2056292 RepID=A0AAD5UUW9_9APHY|nr:hypothetical protein NLI96_g12278 [Physisporinus lineatus]